MKAVMHIEDTDDIQVTLTVTQSVRQWKLLNDAIQDKNNPAYEFQRQINDIVRKVEKHFQGDKNDGS